MKKKGFTLIELIVSIVLVSVVLVSLLGSLLQIRNAYTTIHENSDILVYSSSIARVINNDLSKNNGIRFVSCETDGSKCYLILGNDDRRELTLTEKIEEIPSDSNVTWENIKTTLSYTNTTKYNITNNEEDIDLLYIRTLEMDRYTKYSDASKTEVDKVTSSGFNFYDMSASQYEYIDDAAANNLIDVFTNIKIRMYDGVNLDISEYDIQLYGAGKYDYSNYVGKKYTINLDNKIEANGGYVGTTVLTELFGVGFFKGEGNVQANHQINKIDIPRNSGEGADETLAFMGYFYKPSGVDVEYQIVDSEGNIIASSRLFKKDELDGNVFAKWGTCSNGFTIRNGICVQEEFTVTLDKDGGAGGTDSYKVKYLNRVGKVNIPLKGGHLFTGYNDESGNQYHNSEGNGVEIYRLTTDSTFTAQWQKCRVGTYTPEGVNRCDECVLGSKSGEGSTSCTPCQGGETTSAAGQGSCNATCSNSANVSSWNTASWNSATNKMTNLCSINDCVPGYNLSSNKCVANNYYVKYDANTGSGTVMSNSTHTYGVASNLRANTYTKTGYSFNGWNTAANGSGTSYADKASVSTLTTVNKGTVTLYAQWKANNYTCNQGYYLEKTKTSCTICPAGSYCGGGTYTFSESEDQGKEPCAAGSYSTGTGNITCTPCAVGTYQNGTGKTSCTKCGKGKYQDSTGQTSCKNCGAGTYSGEGASQCTKCSAGSYAEGTGNIECTKCNAGSYSAAGASQCTPCAAGTYSATAGSAACLECTAGKYQDATGQTSCKNCGKGTFSSGTGNTSCTACAAGKYQDAEGQTSCKNCSAGKYQDATGQTSCKNCSAGTYSAAGASQCTKCAKGSYSAANASSCTPCAAGTYQDEEGKTTCKVCGVGKYQDATGQDSCKNCAKGYYNNSTGQTACLACGTGKYQNEEGKTSCKDCSAGYYNNSTGQAACTKCGKGKYQDATGQTSCKNCGKGTYQDTEGQSSCKNCSAGYYNNSTGQSACTKCGVGTYQDATGQTSCKSCSKGYYQDGTGQSSCKKCPANTYQDETGKSSCKSCATGYTSPEGSTSSSDCTKTTLWTVGKKTCNENYSWSNKSQDSASCVWTEGNHAACSSSSDIGKVKDFDCSWIKKIYKCKYVEDDDGDYYYDHSQLINTLTGLDSCTEDHSCNTDGDTYSDCSARKTWKECTRSYGLGSVSYTYHQTSCTKQTANCSSSSHVGNTYVVSCTVE